MGSLSDGKDWSDSTRKSTQENVFLGLRGDDGLNSRAASARISGTTRDDLRKPNRARLVSKRTSHPLPAPVAMRDRESDRARRQRYMPQFDRQDAPAPGEKVRPCRPAPAARTRSYDPGNSMST